VGPRETLNSPSDTAITPCESSKAEFAVDTGLAVKADSIARRKGSEKKFLVSEMGAENV
jgi:hypothetical protein